MKIDNGSGAEMSFHVSPTVSAKPTLSVGGVSVMENEDANPPAARGTEGMVSGRETEAVQSDKLEY